MRSFRFIMRSFRTALFLFLSAVAAAAVISCNQKEFDLDDIGQRYSQHLTVSYDRPWHLVYEGGTDWQKCWSEEDFKMTYESLRPLEPSGLRVVTYNGDTETDIFNIGTYGGDIDLLPGNYSLLLYNNDTEYILFDNLEQAMLAQATTRSRARSSYVGSRHVDVATNENTISPPDILYGCKVNEFECVADGEGSDLSVEMRPLVYRYLIRYHFAKGLQHVTLWRGALAGVAAVVFLSDGHTDDSRATLLFEVEEGDNRFYTDEAEGAGVLYTVVNSFGASGMNSDYYSRADLPYGLNLEVRLRNGNTKNFDFDISDQINRQPRGGVIDVYGIEVSEEDASLSEGAFDVEVSDWGPHQDIII